MRRRLRALAAALAAVVSTALAVPVRAAPCSQGLGGKVVLASDAVDPDVFVWDSSDRLVDYAAGQWGNTRAIFAHTILAEPGTQALVVSCRPSVAHPKFSPADQDAVGVRLTSGPYRGHYGWILSGDAHPMRTAMPQSLRDAGAQIPRSEH